MVALKITDMHIKFHRYNLTQHTINELFARMPPHYFTSHLLLPVRAFVYGFVIIAEDESYGVTTIT